MSKVIPPAGAGVEELIVKVNVVVPLLPSLAATSLTLSIEGVACTPVVAVAELFPATGSAVADVADAVLAMLVPAAPLTVTTIVMVAAEPLASDEKLIVRLFPAPAHVPPAVEEHETNVTEAGRLSVTTND
jgi:hypothetical protein